MLPTGPTKRVSYREEEVEAYKEERGWHEALECRSSSPNALAHLKGADYGRDSWADKSSILIRRWGVCGICGGGGRKFYFHGQHQTIGDCDHCEGTGCEPDSQGEWELANE